MKNKRNFFYRLLTILAGDRRDNVWIASWADVFKYDGKSFTNITGNVYC